MKTWSVPWHCFEYTGCPPKLERTQTGYSNQLIRELAYTSILFTPDQGSHEKLFSEKCFSFCEISRKRKTAKTKNFGFWKIEKLRKSKIKRNKKTKNCEKQRHKQRKTFFPETEKLFFAKKHFYFAIFSRRCFTHYNFTQYF